jgi:hypothetical protein
VSPGPAAPTAFHSGGVVFGLEDATGRGLDALTAAYELFRTTAPADVVLRAVPGAPPLDLLRDADLTFDSGAAWRLYRPAGATVIALRSALLGPEPYCVAVFDPELRCGEVYRRSWDQGLAAALLEFPLAEVVLVCLLARGRGLMVHACGVDDGGRGYLFCGHSGHGKSTTARLWRDQAVILNDDRIVLRERDGRFFIHGTPWHGDFSGVAPHGVALEKVFFLRHAPANRAARRGGAGAAARLLARAFPPLWDEPGMRFTTGVCGAVAERVPCFDLGFVPGPAVVELARCAT